MKPNGSTSHDTAFSPRALLSRVVDVLKSAGFYAYIHLDDQNRWGVSADTDEGHADVRFEGGSFVIEVWDTSPGLFWDEENQRRFHARERRARIVLPLISRGIVEQDHEVWWDETDHGVGARVRSFILPEQISSMPDLIGQQFGTLNQLLAEVERQLLD